MNAALLISASFALTISGFGQPEAPPLTPASVLAGARDVYRSGPIADEITVQLSAAHKRIRSAALIVRLDASNPDTPPVFRVEFDSSNVEPSLIAAYADGSLAAANSDNENDRWIVEGPGPSISDIVAHLPPIPVPELLLALDSDARFDRPTPYTLDAHWSAAEPAPPQRPPVPPSIILRGQSSAGPVEASFDAATFRLRSFHAELQNGQTPLVLDLSIKPVEPGDPAAWRITMAGRRAVPSISDLSPQRGPIPVGDFVSDLSCTHANGSVWSLHQALAALPAPAPGVLTPAVAMILFRTPADAALLAPAEEAARVAVSAARLAATPSAPLDIHLIAAIDLAAYGDQWPALQRRWGVETAQGLAPGWATPSTTINRFAPEAQAALILITADRRLLSVIPLDAQTDAGVLADEIRKALSPPQ